MFYPAAPPNCQSAPPNTIHLCINSVNRCTNQLHEAATSHHFPPTLLGSQVRRQAAAWDSKSFAMVKTQHILGLLLLGCVGVAVYQVAHRTPDFGAAPTTSEDQTLAEEVAKQFFEAEEVHDQQPEEQPVQEQASPQAEPEQQVKMATFTKTVLTPGAGPKPLPKQYVTVSADLYLANADGTPGTGIWSTHKPSGFLFAASGGPQPFEYQAGVGGVVPGWEDGVASMQLGEAARLHIPWQYAYGASGHPGFKIPGKADLIFEISVLAIK